MEQNSFKTLSLFMNPKVLRPLIHQGLLQFPKDLFQKYSTPSNTSFEGRYKPSLLERAAFGTNHFEEKDHSDNPQKVNLAGLIRGEQREAEVRKKTPAELLMSLDDLKNQMPPLPDVSKDFVQAKEGVEQEKQGIPQQKGILPLPSQSSFGANIDKSDGNEAGQQQKNAMKEMVAGNEQAMPKQAWSLVKEQTPSQLSLQQEKEEKQLKTDDLSHQATDYVNAVGNFIHKDKNPKSLWERFRKSEFSEHLMDFFAGLASGKTPQESFSNAAIIMRQGKNVRAQQRPIFEFLRAKGYSEEETKAIVQTPDLAMKIMGNHFNAQEPSHQQTLDLLRAKGYSEEEAKAIVQTPDLAHKIVGSHLNAQEGYRTRTAEEKPEQGGAAQRDWQISAARGEMIPLQGDQNSMDSGQEGDAEKRLLKPETGSMLVREEKTSHGIPAVPMAESGAEHKLIQEQQNEERQNQQRQWQEADQLTRANLAIASAEKLRKKLEESPHIVGKIEDWLAKIPGTESVQQFMHMLDSLKANIEREALRKAKEFLPNGETGLGNLFHQQLQALQNSIAALKQDLSPEQIKKSLTTVIDIFNQSDAQTRATLFGGAQKMGEHVQDAYGKEAETQKKTPSDDFFEKQIETLPEGIFFIDRDGRIKEKTNG
ncbi:hypothetical protein [Bartonella saheliensis]|uniref:hypothetical protein n=1 Tax=Bartonella saheliensis TaxID=1457016 RepID=UPI0011A7B62B|nr:hypothetical protein [Bartonella saheliensis]